MSTTDERTINSNISTEQQNTDVIALAIGITVGILCFAIAIVMVVILKKRIQSKKKTLIEREIVIVKRQNSAGRTSIYSLSPSIGPAVANSYAERFGSESELREIKITESYEFNPNFLTPNKEYDVETIQNNMSAEGSSKSDTDNTFSSSRVSQDLISDN
ncbi:hypothetical protein HK099_000717 [Clydaea vesicula]|uniref:Uncharacterized protein n=1 Tax=Clydaea vesicula TaxID=447962 RepID=A0AAD5U794_9FUNG|nr:hypothetical protein HK099_000717 [Clydaea vesicula]KAJ3388087.1 hypothetical protein HDU92_001632 [Lobulomyces angularis]